MGVHDDLNFDERTPSQSVIVDFDHQGVVCCVRFSRDGTLLATGCNRFSRIFGLRTGSLVCVLNDESEVKDGVLYIMDGSPAGWKVFVYSA